jgi:hypothetical protein
MNSVLSSWVSKHRIHSTNDITLNRLKEKKKQKPTAPASKDGEA